MRLLPLAPIVALALVAPAGLAQQREAAMEAGPGAAGKAWVKLCETPAEGSKDLLGKPSMAGVKTCLIFHEQLDATTGALRVAAGVQQAEARQTLMIRVTPDVSREPGVRLMIIPGDLWQKLQTKEIAALTELQSSRVRKLTLAYSLCVADGCLAETKATQKMVADLKTGGGLMVVTLKGKHAFAYMVSLGGFREAHDGPPIDSARFRKARDELLREIRDRQRQGERRQGDEPRR